MLKLHFSHFLKLDTKKICGGWGRKSLPNKSFALSFHDEFHSTVQFTLFNIFVATAPFATPATPLAKIGIFFNLQCYNICYDILHRLTTSAHSANRIREISQSICQITRALQL